MDKCCQFSAYSVIAISLVGAAVSSCNDAQPTFECATRNTELFQVRYYQQSTTCGADAGFLTASLEGSTAGMQTYVRLSKEGGGGPEVEFRDTTDKLDRSATKLGLRLSTLLSAHIPGACNEDLTAVCAETDAACRAAKKGDITRKSLADPDPNLFFMLPRYGANDICRPLEGGIATSTTKFPSYSCKDGVSIEEVTINTRLSDFALVSSARIPGNYAKGTISFEETRGSGGSCTSVYKVVLLNPIIRCSTDLDCSPEPVPQAESCSSATPSTGEHCFTGNNAPGSGASKMFGSGVSPFLFGKHPDGGFDVRNTCDPVIKRCIWDADVGN